jgi:hypothetical protein
VIIKNLRIREAGALLPLSGNPKLGKSFGTRHRAALGITEETDAVSIVVSEERGTMSLCFDGRMSKNLDADSLRKALYGLFSEEKNRERRKAAEERKSRATKPPIAPAPAEMPDEMPEADEIGEIEENGDAEEEASRKTVSLRPDTPVPQGNE